MPIVYFAMLNQDIMGNMVCPPCSMEVWSQNEKAINILWPKQTAINIKPRLNRVHLVYNKLIIDHYQIEKV